MIGNVGEYIVRLRHIANEIHYDLDELVDEVTDEEYEALVDLMADIDVAVNRAREILDGGE